MVEMLSGLLSFGHFGSETEVVRDGPEGRKLQGPSHFVMAIDPSKFGSEVHRPRGAPQLGVEVLTRASRTCAGCLRGAHEGLSRGAQGVA